MEELRDRYEIAIIGSGIAGASLAYFLARRGIGDVLVVERESQPAYHATGRSAASVVEIDLNPVVQDLKISGAKFLRNPPHGFTENPVLDSRGVLVLLNAARLAEYERDLAGLTAAGMPIRLLDRDEANGLVDGQLDTALFAAAAHLPQDGFIDVHELLQAYSAHARRAGAQFVFSSEAIADVANERCIGIRVNGRRIHADVVVDAGGAWAGEIGKIAGASNVPLVPKRRCMAILDPMRACDLRRWPMVWHDDMRVYFREDAGHLMLCPMDEVPMPPCDASWDEEAIAAGIERMSELAPGLRPRSILHRWAGLRTFASDGVPVVGYDPDCEGFFWLAGQGGCGIETSGALGEIAADLLLDRRTERFDAGLLAPERFRAES